MQALCRSGGIVCDVGANKGSYTYWFSKWSARVVAFEPQPELAAYLKSVAGPNVIVENKGVYSQTGALDLHRDKSGSPGASLVKSAGHAISVPVVALDDYFDKSAPLALLKVDVEGAEMEVFRGAERILSTSQPALLFECERRHVARRDAFDTFRYLEQFGYVGSFFFDGLILPISEFQPDVHQGPKGPYCNNFLFRGARHGD